MWFGEEGEGKAFRSYMPYPMEEAGDPVRMVRSSGPKPEHGPGNDGELAGRIFQILPHAFDFYLESGFSAAQEQAHDAEITVAREEEPIGGTGGRRIVRHPEAMWATSGHLS